MILKPYSNSTEIAYKDFLSQNYFVLMNNDNLKKINLKGINKISKENNPDFKELNENELVPRKFEDISLSSVLMSDDEKPAVTEIVKERFVKKTDSKNIEISFFSLSACFSMEMADIVWILEMSSPELQKGIEVIKDALMFSEKKENYDKCMENIENFKKYLENPTDIKLIMQVKEGFELCKKGYQGNPFPHFFLGLINLRPTIYFNIDLSLNEFIEAKKCSDEIEIFYMSAISSLMIAWIYYIKKETDKAIDYSLKAIDMEFMNLPELYFNLGKYYAAKKDSDNAIKCLDEAIRRFDYLYAVKADIDDDFNLIKPELINYFVKLKDEEKSKVMSRLSDLGISFKTDDTPIETSKTEQANGTN